jgi:hypothetical protein
MNNKTNMKKGGKKKQQRAFPYGGFPIFRPSGEEEKVCELTRVIEHETDVSVTAPEVDKSVNAAEHITEDVRFCCAYSDQVWYVLALPPTHTRT